MTDISWSMQWHSFRLQHMATKCLDPKKRFNREISLATYIHLHGLPGNGIYKQKSIHR